jgi:lipoate-protein ligase A
MAGLVASTLLRGIVAGRSSFWHRLFQSSSKTAFSSVGPGDATVTKSRHGSKITLLDLRGSGMTILERLVMEEALLRYTSRSWFLVGTHEVGPPHKYLTGRAGGARSNNNCCIVLGIGGKIPELVDVEAVRRDQIMMIRRFSGGGTVVLDTNSIWTTVIGRPGILSASDLGESIENGDSFLSPREIMTWTVEQLFSPAFAAMDELQKQKRSAASSSSSRIIGNSTDSDLFLQKTMVMETKSCCGLDSSSGKPLLIPRKKQGESTPIENNFSLREHDYVIGNDRKVAGNAQSITKSGFLHHTSFLWDYDPDNMRYLSLPKKRPEYRGDRNHNDFLAKLCQIYPDLRPRDFVASLKANLNKSFDVEVLTLPQAMVLLDQSPCGGFIPFYSAGRKHGSRTQVVTSF